MNREDRETIAEWSKTSDEEESWDVGHSLVIRLNPEFVEQVKERIVDVIEDDGDYYLDEVAPGFWIDVYDDSLKEWAIDFHELESKWVTDVSVQG